MAREARAGLGRISEIEAARRALVDAAPFQIFERALSLAGAVKGVLKIARRPLVKPVETLFFFRAALRAGRLKALDLDAIALADALDRLGESEVIVLHEEVKNAAAGAAPEAAEYALFLVDGEGGRFLRMKGAEPHVVPAGFFEREVVRNDFHDGGAVADSGNRFVRNHTPRLSFGALRSTARASAGSNILALPSAISCCAKCCKLAPRYEWPRLACARGGMSGVETRNRTASPISRSEEHTSELQSRGLSSHAVFC